MVIKQGKMFPNKPPIISEPHKADIRTFSFRKQNELSRSTFSKLIYMPFRVELHKSHLSCALSWQVGG